MTQTREIGIITLLVTAVRRMVASTLNIRTDVGRGVDVAPFRTRRRELSDVWSTAGLLVSIEVLVFEPRSVERCRRYSAAPSALMTTAR